MKYDYVETRTNSTPAQQILTAKVEVDRGGHLAHPVLGLNLVQARVGVDHVVQLQHHKVLVLAKVLDLELGAAVL